MGLQDWCELLTASVHSGVMVQALDAAMPFDFESRAAERIKTQQSLNIGIVGFGTFGQFLGKRIIQHGHKVNNQLAQISSLVNAFVCRKRTNFTSVLCR